MFLDDDVGIVALLPNFGDPRLNFVGAAIVEGVPQVEGTGGGDDSALGKRLV